MYLESSKISPTEIQQSSAQSVSRSTCSSAERTRSLESWTLSADLSIARRFVLIHFRGYSPEFRIRDYLPRDIRAERETRARALDNNNARLIARRSLLGGD